MPSPPSPCACAAGLSAPNCNLEDQSSIQHHRLSRLHQQIPASTPQSATDSPRGPVGCRKLNRMYVSPSSLLALSLRPDAVRRARAQHAETSRAAPLHRAAGSPRATPVDASGASGASGSRRKTHAPLARNVASASASFVNRLHAPQCTKRH